jgi:hypothetical protein
VCSAGTHTKISNLNLKSHTEIKKNPKSKIKIKLNIENFLKIFKS